MLRSGALLDNTVDAGGLIPARVVDQSNVARRCGEVLDDLPGPVMAASVGDHDPDTPHGFAFAQHRVQTRSDMSLLIQYRDGNDHALGRNVLDPCGSRLSPGRIIDVPKWGHR